MGYVPVYSTKKGNITMSWSISVMGQGRDVNEQVQRELKAHHLVEPEESMKDKVAEIVEAATAAAPFNGFVVRAEGSQYQRHDGLQSEMVSLHLKVEIDVVQWAYGPPLT
jgi:hypothetical protein